MSEKRTTMLSPSKAEALKDQEERTDWERLRKMSDEEAEAAASSDPDAPPTDEQFWNEARLVWPGSKSGSSS